MNTTQIFRPKTRYEVLNAMKEGIKCEVPKNISAYNSDLINFWAEEYNYQKSHSVNRGYFIYEPDKKITK